MVEIGKLQKATAWVQVDDFFPFMVGPDATGDKLGVVRLGGHLEPGESPWEGVCREVLEEASLKIAYVRPPCTYRADIRGNLERLKWRWGDVCPAPMMFSQTGIAFLATSTDEPIPDCESHGLLLLTPEDVNMLCSKPFTLGEYLHGEGQAVFNSDLPSLDEGMELDPKGPRVFKLILELHPDLGIS